KTTLQNPTDINTVIEFDKFVKTLKDLWQWYDFQYPDDKCENISDWLDKFEVINGLSVRIVSENRYDIRSVKDDSKPTLKLCYDKVKKIIRQAWSKEMATLQPESSGVDVLETKSRRFFCIRTLQYIDSHETMRVNNDNDLVSDEDVLEVAMGIIKEQTVICKTLGLSPTSTRLKCTQIMRAFVYFKVGSIHNEGEIDAEEAKFLEDITVGPIIRVSEKKNRIINTNEFHSIDINSSYPSIYMSDFPIPMSKGIIYDELPERLIGKEEQISSYTHPES
ncbi:Hypothetical protein, putative, partial [Bodo saltans]